MLQANRCSRCRQTDLPHSANLPPQDLGIGAARRLELKVIKDLIQKCPSLHPGSLYPAEGIKEAADKSSFAVTQNSVLGQRLTSIFTRVVEAQIDSLMFFLPSLWKIRPVDLK